MRTNAQVGINQALYQPNANRPAMLNSDSDSNNDKQ
jgi:hypothetical protein